MGLLTLLRGTRATRQLERMADQLASESFESVFHRVSPQSGVMSDHERRGYIRAHASAAIRRAVQKNAQLAESDRTKLTTRATNQVVQLVLANIRLVEMRRHELRRAG